MCNSVFILYFYNFNIKKIHTGRFFVLIPLKWLEKLTGVKDKDI
jgi:hypothetical protein